MRGGYAIHGDAGRVVASGELDLAAADHLRMALARWLRDERVEVDLAGVSFFDSSAAEPLIELVEAGALPTLRGARPIVARVLELVGLGPYVVPAHELDADPTPAPDD